MILHLTFADGSNPFVYFAPSVQRAISMYKRFARSNDCTALFIAPNGCKVRQDVLKNWYVYTDDAHAPKEYAYLKNALKCAVMGGVHA